MRGVLPLSVLAVVVVLSLVCVETEGKRVMGNLDTPEDFEYLCKFAYYGEKGVFDLRNSAVFPHDDSKAGKILMTVYTDESSKEWYWNNVRKKDVPCSQKIDRQNTKVFTQTGGNVTLNGTSITLTLRNTARVHYWYFAASDCGMAQGERLQMTAEIHMYNSELGFWYREFSFEDQDLLTLYVVFSIIWLLGSISIATLLVLLKNKDQLSFVVKLFGGGVLVYDISLVLYFLHYITYATNGVGIPSFLVIADVCDMLHTVMFFTVLMLIAGGSTLDSKEYQNIRWESVVFVVLTMFYIGFFLWQEVWPTMNPERNEYKWQTPPGIVMLIIRVLMCGVFVATIFFSFQKEPQAEKRYFLLVFLLFCIWWLYLPFMAIIAGTGIPPYYRWKTMCGLSLAFNTVATGLLAFFQWPSKHTKLFSFNKDRNIASRVTQSELLVDDDDSSPYGTL